MPRSGHCLAALPEWHEDDAILFGGYVETASKSRHATNDAWIFNMQSQSWRRVQPAGTALPQARLVAQAVVVRDFLWLVGGWDPGQKGDGGEILGDIWRLDLRSYTWEQVTPQGEALQPISRFQAVAVGPKIFIHNHRSIEDIHVLDTSTTQPTLSRLPVRGWYPDDISPPSRGLHSMTALGDSLYVFGGAPQQGPMMDDLWRLDLASMTWRELHPAGPKPHSRCSQVAGAVGRYVVFFGGAFYGQNGGLVMTDTLFVLDTERNTWVFPPVKGPLPSPRNASAMCAVSGGLLMYGGWKAFQESYNDTHLLTLTTSGSG